MSYDEQDAEREAELEYLYDQFRSEPATREGFYEELYDEVVQDFTAARLCSFYVGEPLVAEPALRALADARQLLAQHDTAAFTFAAISAEVGLRSTLLKPIVYGLVHAESAAALITKLAIAHNDEGFTKVLLNLLAAHGGVDPRLHRRTPTAKTLWNEILDVRKKRNAVVHQGETASRVEAELAIAVAACILDELFPAVVKKLGLHLHGSRVCDTPPTVLGGHQNP